MNEFELIEKLTRSLPTNKFVVTGSGDDCAVLDIGLPDKLLLFKTDALVEGVHFRTSAPPEKIGHKALARCLSDIAGAESHLDFGAFLPIAARNAAGFTGFMITAMPRSSRMRAMSETSSPRSPLVRPAAGSSSSSCYRSRSGWTI